MVNLKKKIVKSDLFSYFIVLIAWLYSRLLFLTCKFSVEIDKEAQELLDCKRPFLMLSWHGRLFIWPEFMKKFGNFSAVVSTHSDGEHLSRFIKLSGHKSIRGSSTKEAFSALAGLIRMIRDNNTSVGITPDGPRGPRFVIQNDIIAISQKIQAPILTFSYSSTKAKVLNTWDRFIIPSPFSKIYVSVKLPTQDNLKNIELLTNFMVEDMYKIDRISKIKILY